MKPRNMLARLIDKIPIEIELMAIAFLFYFIVGAITLPTSRIDKLSPDDKRQKAYAACVAECQIENPSLFIFNN